MTPVRPIAEWKALAAQFKPYVHLVDSTVGNFDYDDPYQPSSVEWYLGQCRLKVRYDPDVDVVHPTARQLLMHNVPQAYLEPDSEEVYLGDRTTAPYYVHIFPGPSGSIELDYWFYYPYNGPAMTGAAPFLAYWGRHEGDWEHVTVRIGGSPYKVLAARFAAHGSEDVGFISPGKDASAETFQVIGQRTVAYSAFHTHASYPDPDLLWQSSLGYWDGQRWNGQTTKFAQSLPIGTAPPTDIAETMDNKLVLFGVSSADKQAYRCEQKVTGEDGNWTPWYSLGDRQVVSVTASVGVGGNLTALARTNKGLVYQSERSVSGEWSEMLEFGTGMGPVALGGNADGRLEAFGIWGGAVQHRWQQVST